MTPAPAGRVRLGVMGGTFDPVHYGHLVAASEVAARFELDRVLFVPTGRPWQKERAAVSPAEDRYLMTVIATASNPRFAVDRVDIDRPGPTYTTDTLRDLARAHPDAELFFITGADALEAILSWKDVDELWSLAHFVAVSRPGHSLATADLPSGSVSMVEIPALAISSSDIRRRVQDDSPVRYLVPDGVRHYIAKTGLYRAAASAGSQGSPAVEVADGSAADGGPAPGRPVADEPARGGPVPTAPSTARGAAEVGVAG